MPASEGSPRAVRQPAPPGVGPGMASGGESADDPGARASILPRYGCSILLQLICNCIWTTNSGELVAKEAVWPQQEGKNRDKPTQYEFRSCPRITPPPA